ncbi:MAG: tyrosine-protein phosphatase [Ruminiclostridium sp.]|nr:tyrosine-protein phosphatase [Ruminiclostridium sp.]
MRKNRTVECSADNPQRIVLSEQNIGLASILNARELGGYINTDGLRIKRGRLIRSGQLFGIVKTDIDILTKNTISVRS